MTTLLQTKRLCLREFTLHDTDFIIELVNSPGWLKFIGDRNIKNSEQAKSYLENGPMKSYKENGFGLCLVETINDKLPIGMCGLVKRDNLENPDIGFAFLPAYTGQGYAFEMASATLSFALERFHLKTILAITLPDNNSSIKLIGKLGMKFMKTLVSPDGSEELMLFSN